MNINDSVAVRLTDYGEELWNKAWTSTNGVVPIVIRESKTLPDGRVRFQLWELMNIFGPSMYMGNPRQAFLDNIVEVIK